MAGSRIKGITVEIGGDCTALDKALKGVNSIMNLAAASGEDLATTSDIVTDALTAFGLAASDSGHFADVLASASASANTNVSLLGESFKMCAPVCGSLGISAEDLLKRIRITDLYG
jgi:TP901 family phage tail tape measure protein